MDKDKNEICTIRIVFPVESDEQALEYKRKIDEVLADSKDAQLHFSIMSAQPLKSNM